MTLKRDYSDSNILESIAASLATKILSENYLIYWQSRDMVQTLDGLYYQWSTNYSTHMADATFSARVAAADGMVTLIESLPASPTWIFRPITTAGPIAQDEVLLPVISVEIGPSRVIREYELGSTAKWRYRHLILDGYVRTKEEQRKIADWLSDWFDTNEAYTINNHDTGTLAVLGDVSCTETDVDVSTDPVALAPIVFQVICNSRLEYIA